MPQSELYSKIQGYSENIFDFMFRKLEYIEKLKLGLTQSMKVHSIHVRMSPKVQKIFALRKTENIKIFHEIIYKMNEFTRSLEEKRG